MFSANYKLSDFGRSINEKAKQLNLLNQYLKAIIVFLVRLLKVSHLKSLRKFVHL